MGVHKVRATLVLAKIATGTSLGALTKQVATASCSATRGGIFFEMAAYQPKFELAAHAKEDELLYRAKILATKRGPTDGRLEAQLESWPRKASWDIEPPRTWPTHDNLCYR